MLQRWPHLPTYRGLAAWCLLALAAAQPARADLSAAIEQHILPGYTAFAEASAALASASQQSCAPEALRPAFHAAWDAWAAVAHLHLGPAEQEGRALAILFWPDPKGLGAKAQQALLRAGPEQLAPAAFAEQSVAARGLTGLERLLYTDSEGPDPCPLIRATAQDLARMAAEIEAGWQGQAGFAAQLLAAGTPAPDASAADTPASRYLTQKEARQAVFTQLITGLEALADTRIGRPLGSFDRPRPERAEARLSGRAARNVTLSLIALRDLAMTLEPDASRTAAAIDHAIALAEALGDPDFQAIAASQPWLKLQILQQAVRAARDSAMQEIAPRLGVSMGFNALDGD